MSAEVQGKMARGAVWMVLFKFVERGLGLISTLILARLLVPEDFGTVAMAMAFIAMAELLTAFGFDIAIIQNPKTTREHFDSAWTGNVVMNCVIALLIAAMAMPIAEFYRKPELVWVVLALSLGPILSGLENIGVVTFRKELDFRREFRYQVTRKLLGFAIVVPLAFTLRNYWALVIGMLFTKGAGTVISYLMHPFRPRFSFSHFRQLFVFSRWLLLNNFVQFLKDRSSDFFVGRMFGATPLGIYNIAYELSNLPTTEISAPINRALLPGFAKMEKPEQVAKAYSNAVGLLALLALPAAACIFAVSPYLVATLLGSKWLAAIPLMQVLAFHGALLLFQSSMGSILFARGFPATVTGTNGFYAVLLVSLLGVFLGWFSEVGLIGAAYAALLTSAVCTPLFLYQMHRCLRMPLSLFVRAIRRPFVAAAVMVGIVELVLPRFEPTASAIVNMACLAVGVVVATLTYVAAILLLWRLEGRPIGAESIAWAFLCDQAKERLGWGRRTPPTSDTVATESKG